MEKKRAMSFKKWIAVFTVTVILIGALICGLNALVDPFGIFGDVLFDWYAYDMTQNPRAAKIAYLDKYFGKYDSYIIGCSKTGSYSTKALNEYYGGASFYNMLMYGGDMYDIELTTKYILENYDVKNIVINMGLEETVRYDTQADEMKSNMHAKVDGSSQLAYYGKYLFANPSYAFSKINAWYKDEYLVNENDVFLPESGVYDKSVRDVERVSSVSEYLTSYPSFKTVLKKETLDAKDKCLGSIKRIKEMCDAKGVSFMLIISPIFHTEMDIYDKVQLEEFLAGLSQITDYWDFSGYNSISYEPRYFYDPYHFRNAVGEMALAKIFGNDSIYIPEDLGRHVTADNIAEHLSLYYGSVGTDGARDADQVSNGTTDAEANSHSSTGTTKSGDNNWSSTVPTAYSRNIPVLMYHHLDDEAANNAIITPERFEEHMIALKGAGYSAISLTQLIEYVDKGFELPENPVLITFDDGYASNYELAYPILEKYNMKAVINIIGVTVGKDTYKDTGTSIIPHFTYEEAREMIESGIIEIQSHSYDMHNSEVLDVDYRQGVYKKTGESDEDYFSAFCSDFRRSEKEIADNIGGQVISYAYPNGFYTTLSEVLLSNMGVKVTMTVEEGMNTVIKGLPQSLRAMKRYRVHNGITGSELVERLELDGQNAE